MPIEVDPEELHNACVTACNTLYDNLPPWGMRVSVRDQLKALLPDLVRFIAREFDAGRDPAPPLFAVVLSSADKDADKAERIKFQGDPLQEK
jgi:hypothetical protein